MKSGTPSVDVSRALVDGPRPLRHNPDFLLLWSGQFVSTLGTRFSGLALPLLVLALTHSPAQVGLISATQLVPYLIFGLPAGALVDRWDRKVVMIMCDLIRFLAFGSVPLAVVLGHLAIAQLYLIAVVDGVSFVFFNTAQVAALPRVVAASQLPQATALNETAGTTATLIGPALSGLIISLGRTTLVGATLAYLLDSVSYLMSALSLSAIRTPFQAPRGTRTGRSLRAEVRDGLRFLSAHPHLRLIALLSMGITLCESPVYLAVVVLAQRSLRADARTIGLIISAAGLGGVIGSLLAQRLARRLSVGHMLIGLTAIKAAAIPLAAVAVSPAVLGVSVAIVVMTGPIYNVVQIPYRLSLIPDALQGRVNSVFRLLSFGGVSVGTAVGGLLLSPLGARMELWFIAVGLGFCTLIVSTTSLRHA